MAGEKGWLGPKHVAPGRSRRQPGPVLAPRPVPRPKPYVIPWLRAVRVQPGRRRRPGSVHRCDFHLIDFARRYWTGRAQHRVFNAATFRLYRSNSAPPSPGDTPFATPASLPSTPADTYADGTWYLSVSYFNGVLDSGFLPLGSNGETYLRLDLSGGAEVGSPPQAPAAVYLEQRSGGVVRVHALCAETGALRPDTWAIAYTVDGSTPATSSPDATEAFTASAGVAVLSYDLPAQANGTTVKVRVQLERDGAYSEGSTVLTTTADAAGPGAPTGGESWRGAVPE